MKRLTHLAFLLFFPALVYAQKAAERNPGSGATFSETECRRVNRMLGIDTFDCCSKRVGIAELTFGSRVFQRHDPASVSGTRSRDVNFRLVVLDAAEKQRTAGFDAIILRYASDDELEQRWLKRSDIVDAVYGGVTDDDSTDSSRRESDIRFVNGILSQRMKRPIDIRSTKTAFVETKYEKEQKILPLSIGQYRRLVEEKLSIRSEDIGSLHLLNAQQQQASGGYALIVQLGESKKACSVDELAATVLLH